MMMLSYNNLRQHEWHLDQSNPHLGSGFYMFHLHYRLPKLENDLWCSFLVPLWFESKIGEVRMLFFWLFSFYTHSLSIQFQNCLYFLIQNSKYNLLGQCIAIVSSISIKTILSCHRNRTDENSNIKKEILPKGLNILIDDVFKQFLFATLQW